MLIMEKSYICGATNVFAWIAICSGIAIIAPQLILGMAGFWYPGYVRQPWHAFLVYQAANLVVLGWNVYVLKRAMWVHDVACKSPVLFHTSFSVLSSFLAIPFREKC
jgi:choline transport protein